MSAGERETLDLDAIEARANAATPGPWRKEPRLSINGGVESEAMGVGNVPALMLDIESERSRSDAEFIAEARTDVPGLVAEVRRLREEARLWRAWARVQQRVAELVPADRPGSESALWADEAIALADLRAAGIDPDAPEGT